MRISAEFTPQELECIRIALDHYEAENDEHADSLEGAPDEHDQQAMRLYRNEASVARAARAKVRSLMSPAEQLIADIAAVVYYSWESEYTDYLRSSEEGNDIDGHIFESLQRLRAWVEA